MASNSETYKQKEVAEKFGFSENYYSIMIKKGKAPVQPIPGTTRYSKTFVDFVLSGKAQVEAAKRQMIEAL